MKTFIQIHLMESKHHTSLMMHKYLFVCTLVLTSCLTSCRPSSTPHSDTSSSKVEPEKVFEPENDTVLVQQTLESTAESGTFRFESAVTQPFSQKQLNEMMNIIHTQHDKLTDLSLKNNITGWGMGSYHITVTFMVNTPEARKAFREKIIDSPAVVFEGPTAPSRNDRVGVSDTLGICLQSDYPVYSTKATQATFTLVNQSNRILECGDPYSITYEDEKGIWRNLPIHTAFFDIAYAIKPEGKKQLSGDLYPEVHANKPGRYRFFYEVTLLDSDKTITLMAEFRLTNRKEEWEQAQKKTSTPIPTTRIRC